MTKVGQFWICPEHGQVSLEDPFAPLRIFLSYGHDGNESLVRRIKSDLEKRGHDVWFDKSEIKFGDDWRQSITEGIIKSSRVLSFLSKHSTRDPGVCRDEIAIAIGVKGGGIQSILVESEQEVQPPVNISHIQWLDMHDWKEGHGVVNVARDTPVAGDVAWEQWYQNKLAEIIRVVESQESRRFAGDIQRLGDYLKPIKSDARIYDLLKKGFFGRSWLFEAVEGWRQDAKRDSRLFWITGDPGVGKSAFAAQLTHTRSDAVIAAQFVEWDKPDHRDARRVIRSLAFQLATRLPDYRKLLLTLPEIAELDRKDPAELFDYLLANPLRSVIGGGRERQLIVIDALDEAGSASAPGEAGRNPLVEMLARHAPRLPDWLGLVVTSRPESAVQTPLQGLNPFVLDTRTKANRADLRDYLRRKLAPQLHDRPDADRLVGQILEKTEGVFLYVERFCDDVQQNHLSLDRPEQFPQGLGGIFCQWFQRQFPDLEKFRQDVRPALRAILAAREPLPVEILQRLFHWQDEELRDFTRTLGSLFPVTKEANGEVIKPYHKSLADWLADEAKAGPYFVSVIEGHRTLRDHCRAGWTEEEFSLAHFPSHLAQCGDWDELSVLLMNSTFIRTKRTRIGYSALALDYQWTDECLATLREASERELFKRVCSAVKRLSTFSGRHDEAAFAEQWLHDGHGNCLLVVGIGGVGKTMFLKHLWLGEVRARVFWYSFYEKGAVMRQFYQDALAHITQQPLDTFDNKTTLEMRVELLAQIHAKPWLLILDGLERVLVAYHRIDAADVPDQNRHPCDAICDDDTDLLRAFATAAPSKILISSRLIPRVLLNEAGIPLPGVKVLQMSGLGGNDAERLLRSYNIQGTSANIRTYLKNYCGNHPLVIATLAGLINSSGPYQGNFDAWAADPEYGGKLNLGGLDLIQSFNHILHAAIEALEPASRELLSTLALLSSSVDYETVAAFNPHLPPTPKEVGEATLPEQHRRWDRMTGEERRQLRQQYEATLAERAAYEEAMQAWRDSEAVLAAPEQLSKTMKDLQHRGLLQYDARTNRYDLHPIIRAVVAGGMKAEDKDRYGLRARLATGRQKG